jgi:hypothetical protein
MDLLQSVDDDRISEERRAPRAPSGTEQRAVLRSVLGDAPGAPGHATRGHATSRQAVLRWVKGLQSVWALWCRMQADLPDFDDDVDERLALHVTRRAAPDISDSTT